MLAVFSQAAGTKACNKAANAATNNVIEKPIANKKCWPKVSSTERGWSKNILFIMSVPFVFPKLTKGAWAYFPKI